MCHNVVSLISGLIMIGVFAINQRFQKTKSSSLKSARKDNLSDGLVSMGTAIGLVFTQFGLPIVDVILATILDFNYLYRVWYF